MATDYTKDPDEILVDLVNSENGRSFTVNDLLLSNLAIAPDPVSGRETFNNVRTSLRIDAAPNSGYTNGVDIKYNRVNLRNVFPNNDDDSTRYPTSTDDGIKLEGRTSLVELLPEINERYQINLKPGDIYDLPLPTFDGAPPYDPVYIRFEIQSGHKIFIGGVQIQILPDTWDLSNLQFTELNGLYYPNGDDTPAFVQTSQDIDDQFTQLGENGGWNHSPA